MQTEKKRCSWCDQSPLYQAYHDHEWGFPVAEDRRLFEKLCLEGFQAGLSWLTILRKREAFRQAFAGFDIQSVARFGPDDVQRLLNDAGIVRHRGKIEAAINNAQCTEKLLQGEASLASYLWRFEPTPAKRPAATGTVVWTPISESAESQALSRDLKRRGFRFVGPTTMYALMQAMGLVNDHQPDCHVRELAEQARSDFRRPS